MLVRRIIIFCFIFLVTGGSSLAVDDTAASLLNKNIDSLFVIASSGELKYRDMVQPAIDSIAALGAPAVPRLVELYKSHTARERHTVDEILKKIGNEAVPYLRQSLAFDDFRQVSRVCYTLGEIKDSSAVEDLIAITNHPEWQVRSGSAGALGKIGDKRADAAIIKLLSDSVETVRKSAAVAAGSLMTEAAIEELVHMLGDNFYGPRMCASEALVKMGSKSIKPIIDSLDSDNIMTGDLGCTTLGQIGGDMAAFGVTHQLESDMPTRRALAVEAIGMSESPLACGLIELLKEQETDPMVLFFIDRALEKYATR